MDILPTLGVTEGMGYGFVFLIGLAASVSTCMAVTGGLLVATAAKYNERFGAGSGFRAFRPHLSFNAGRIVSYTVFGGMVGALGSVIALSPGASGAVTVAVSIVMLILGFQILGIFPRLARFAPRMPKGIAHWLSRLTDVEKPHAPFLLGAGTFFLPCGFTQALQLYVLTTGSWVTGALTMFTFSLGTLPALLALGAVSSFARGTFQRYFLRFAGAVVVLLAVLNVQSGMALAGWKLPAAFSLPTGQTAPAADAEELPPIVDGKQVVRMRVAGYEYSPNRFRVRAGVPVEWHVDGAEATGCGRVLTAPAVGVRELLPGAGEKVITFTPRTVGEIAFNCSMGMMTPNSAFVVVDEKSS